MNEDDPKLSYVKIETASQPISGLNECIKDSWWMHHPERGLIFYDKQMSPQCNKNKLISEMVQKRLYPWADIVFVPFVYRRINPNDYV